MLVLTRKVGEGIVIGGNIHVQIVHMGGGKVRIGIVAPEDVTVDRQEVHSRKVNALTEQALPLSITRTSPGESDVPVLVI